MNRRTPLSLCYSLCCNGFIYSVYAYTYGITGSYGTSIFNFLKNSAMLFKSNILYSNISDLQFSIIIPLEPKFFYFSSRCYFLFACFVVVVLCVCWDWTGLVRKLREAQRSQERTLLPHFQDDLLVLFLVKAVFCSYLEAWNCHLTLTCGWDHLAGRGRVATRTLSNSLLLTFSAYNACKTAPTFTI